MTEKTIKTSIPEGADPIRVAIAGSGGQGIVSMSFLLARIGMNLGLQVSWFPSYGAEMRGGTATCSVILSEKEIASPIFSQSSHALVFNGPSLAKCEPKLSPGGTLIYDSDLVDEGTFRETIRIVPVPAEKLAEQAGNLRAANMVMLGTLLSVLDLERDVNMEQAMKEVFPERHWNWIPANVAAVRMGQQYASTLPDRRRIAK